jgi:hypothetical protein
MGCFCTVELLSYVTANGSRRQHRNLSTDGISGEAHLLSLVPTTMSHAPSGTGPTTAI